MKLIVIIPVFNEQKTLKESIEKVLSQSVVKRILVVDDGSTDKTPEILRSIGNNKIKVITHHKNLGKGAALRTGFSKVSGDFVIVQDADLEYNPHEYSKLLKSASPDTVVYGSRIKGQNAHAYTMTYLGNVLVTLVCNLLFGTKLTDSYTCYKLLPTKIAKELKLQSNGFEIEAEITANLLKKGIKIIEVPIKYSPRTYEQGKKIKAKDALLGILTYLKIRFYDYKNP